MRPIIILGAGGHTGVLIDCLQLLSQKIIAIVDATRVKRGEQTYLGYPLLASDHEVRRHYRPVDIRLVNGLGFMPRSDSRAQVFAQFKKGGFQFLTIVHPSATVASTVSLAEGVQVMAGVVLQPCVSIGENSLVNTASSIDHDCILEKNVNLSPGSIVCGQVSIGQNTYIGAGATIVNNVQIADNVFICAGALVTNDLLSKQRVNPIRNPIDNETIKAV